MKGLAGQGWKVSVVFFINDIRVLGIDSGQIWGV